MDYINIAFAVLFALWATGRAVVTVANITLFPGVDRSENFFQLLTAAALVTLLLK